MKIVCAIDGSRYSAWALEWIAHVCEPDTSSLLLVHAVDMAPFKPLPRLDRKARAALVRVLETSLEGAARLLESAEMKVSKTWGDVKAKLLRGSPAEAIVRAATREHADLLVAGSRGTSDFQPMLIGSVSRKLLMQAPCPVLIIKKPAKTLARLVLGTDGSRESWDAVALLQQLPRDVRPDVLVVSVIPPLPLASAQGKEPAASQTDQVRQVLEREAHKLVARAVGTLKKTGFPATGKVVSGHPAAEIVKLAGSERANLTVVGSRSGRSPSEYLLGSVADSVVKHAPCSVLVHRR